MTRLQHVHALVRHALGRRKPAAHGPAFRATALVTGLAIAATTLAVTASRASAAERAPAHRPAPATLARAAGLGPLARPAGANHRARPAAGPAPDRDTAEPAASPGHPSPLGSALTGPSQEAAPLLPAHNVPPRDAAPQSTPPQQSAPSSIAPQGAASQGAAPGAVAPPGTAPQGTAPDEAPPEGAAAGALPAGIPESRRLEQGFAEDVLRGHGIRWRSTGGCSDRKIRTCTSFEKIRWGTIKGLIGFATSSGCEITVTGGTERGHANGPRSHWNGYKADISPSRCVDRAVERYPSAGVRGDGAKLYRSPDGALFAREKDHWDITFP